MSNKKSGAKTLLWSLIMSSPGPLVVGLGLLAGRSSTQIADFVRNLRRTFSYYYVLCGLQNYYKE